MASVPWVCCRIHCTICSLRQLRDTHAPNACVELGTATSKEERAVPCQRTARQFNHVLLHAALQVCQTPFQVDQGIWRAAGAG
jgi:hypothetical protein